MATLDNTQQRLLENAPDNPRSPKKSETVVAARPGMGFSKSTTGPPKPSLRETMMAQKKAALANKNLPARPGSAMSSFSPMRTVSSSSTSSTVSAASDAPVRSRPETSAVAHGGLSVAPMRPTKFRPRPEIVRPATAGPYSVRRPGHVPSNSDTISPSSVKILKTRTPSVTSNSPPKKVATRPNTSHSSHASQSSHSSPSKSTISRVAASPRPSPAKSKSIANVQASSSPSKANEAFTMIVPTISGLTEPDNAKIISAIDSSDDEAVTPAKSLKVYEDPFSSNSDQTTPRPMFTAPVLEELPVNEDAANLSRNGAVTIISEKVPPMTPEQRKQNSRLLDSGITKIKAKSLDVHGFRKLQGMIKENKAGWNDEKFDMLLSGLFAYLEAPLASLAPEKGKDVKAQILATINLMYKKDREAFRGYVTQGLESLIAARSSYDSRSHIVSGMELLADELVTLADPNQTCDRITAKLQGAQFTLEGCRTLSMGLHVLKELIEAKKEFVPSDVGARGIGKLAARCLDSSDSGVRMDAVQLCVALHARVGEPKFWIALDGLKDTPRNLITYYIAKHQNELKEAAA